MSSIRTAAAIPTQRRRGRTPAPAVPLGSLTQAARTGADGCSTCGGTRLTQLEMMLTDGTPVRFSSCHRCETKVWETAEGVLSVADVLERTRKTA